jgi:hypothetical protein
MTLTVNVPPQDQNVNLSEADKAALAKVDEKNKEVSEAVAAGNQEGSTTERPSWLPEKFATPEDMAKAYAELSSKLGNPDASKTPAATDAPADEAEANKAVAQAGLDMDALRAEFAETGDLKPETYAKFKAAGIPEEIVKGYIEGQKVVAENYTNSVKAVAEGQFDTMAAWAATNLQPAELAAYNKAVDSGDADIAKLAVAGVYQKFVAANGKDPALVNGANSDGKGDVFESTRQVTDAMRDKRYKTDPAFRKAVQDKLARSSVF